MKRIWNEPWCVGGLLSIAVLAMGLVGCEWGSSSETFREVGLQISGQYQNPDGRVVERNTGAAIRRLGITQIGDRLTAIDNNGVAFEGRIYSVSGARASISLKGPTTSGAEGTLTGEITVSGTTAILRGNWTEPTLFANVYGQATVQGVVTNATPGTNTVINP